LSGHWLNPSPYPGLLAKVLQSKGKLYDKWAIVKRHQKLGVQFISNMEFLEGGIKICLVSVVLTSYSTIFELAAISQSKLHTMGHGA